MNQAMDAGVAPESAFALAWERLAAEDAERMAWLDQRCKGPDVDENDPVPLNKAHAPADGRCIRWGCKRKVRCKGLCSTHYWQTASRRQRARKPAVIV